MSKGIINAVVREKYIGVTGQTLFVARPVTYSRIDTETILARAAENSGIDQGVLAYAFFAIMKTFQNFLFNGHVVELGPLGTFRVSFSCKAGATNEDCNASGIRCRRVIYNLSKRLKRELAEVAFDFQASPPSPLPEKGGGDEPNDIDNGVDAPNDIGNGVGVPDDIDNGVGAPDDIDNGVDGNASGVSEEESFEQEEEDGVAALQEMGDGGGVDDGSYHACSRSLVSGIPWRSSCSTACSSGVSGRSAMSSGESFLTSS